MIVRLDQAPVEEVGGKAAGLAKLVALGLPVPPAVVVPSSARGVLEDPDRVVRELGEPLAVRSSAVAEDAAGRSAAGQYESLMGVHRAALQKAVERVYRSAESERVRAYGAGGGGMAVVIQRAIEPSRAGVAFSRDPFTDEEHVLIECVFGHGEQLVSGDVNPDRYVVYSDGRVEAHIAAKDGPLWLLRSLRDDEARTVAELTRRAEDGFGHPVDVEFAFEETRLWLVQARAITTLPAKA